MKAMFKFILIFIMIIVIYLGIILNIDFFMKSYDKKLEEHKNIYYKERDSQYILDKLLELEYKYQDISNEDIEKIKTNKIINNLLQESLGIEEKIETYLNKLIESDSIKILKSDYDIIIIEAGLCNIAFSLDGNNIIYETRERAIEYKYIENWEAKKITEEDKNRIYEEINKKFKELGITEKLVFDPESIYIKYFNEIIAGWDEEIYVVEDNTNNIKLEFEVPSNKISNLQIGFENL